jgi:hypothetical protein
MELASLVEEAPPGVSYSIIKFTAAEKLDSKSITYTPDVGMVNTVPITSPLVDVTAVIPKLFDTC